MTIAQLEKHVEQLKKIISRELTPKRNAKWWLDHAGVFSDDSGYEEIVRLGRRYRESLKSEPRKAAR
jgi:hypothetical protein